MMLQLNEISGNPFLWEDVNVGDKDCAFCREYFNGSCRECPIVEVSGAIHCYKTPYEDIRYFRWMWNYEDSFNAISEEINFFISLGES